MLQTRRKFLVGTSAAIVAAGSLTTSPARAADKVSLMISWKPQADYGGYYEALIKGIYAKHGLDVEIRPGGPQIDGAQLLVAGRVDFLCASSFAGLHYAREGLPFLVTAAIFQKDPQILMVHPESGYNSLADLKGKPTFIGQSSRTSFWPFLKAKFGYTDEQIRPFNFTYAPFLADKTSVQQGYINADVDTLRKNGFNPKVFLLSDVGYANYTNTLNTSRKLVDSNPDLVQRFINASIEGWYSYLYGDPKATFAKIKAENPEMTDAELNYNYNTFKDMGLVDSGDSKTLGIGAMTDARWEAFAKDNIATGNLPANLDWKQAYTTKFVNKKVGM
jgi:NitT/TauT family transport system substrate-binding protein